MEGLVGYPLAVDKGTDIHFYALISRLLQQGLPIVDVEYGLVATGVDGDVASLYLDGFAIGTQQKVERGYILWNSYITVVGINRWQSVALLYILRGGCTRGKYYQYSE
jgi:hypothetical protein